MSFLFYQQSHSKAQLEAILENESLSGLKFSSVYYGFEITFMFLFSTIYVPRSIFYIIYLAFGMRIKKLLWLMNIKMITFFLICLASGAALCSIVAFNSSLKNTFGTGLMYMVILFMIPIILWLLLDLFLCLVTKDYLEERIWLAQPKVQHSRRTNDENEIPVHTKLIHNERSRVEGLDSDGYESSSSSSSDDEKK